MKYSKFNLLAFKSNVNIPFFATKHSRQPPKKSKNKTKLNLLLRLIEPNTVEKEIQKPKTPKQIISHQINACKIKSIIIFVFMEKKFLFICRGKVFSLFYIFSGKWKRRKLVYKYFLLAFLLLLVKILCLNNNNIGKNWALFESPFTYEIKSCFFSVIYSVWIFLLV